MRHSLSIRLGLMAAAVMVAAGSSPPAPAQPLDRDTPRNAMAIMMDRSGERLGSAALVETPSGVMIQLKVEGVAPGGHGFHIHQVGTCDPPDFKSAGDHFSPNGREHGFLNAGGAHAGDLPNVYASETGAIRADILVEEISLEGGPLALADEDGSALVIHATVDDYATDPAGHAGDRIACGVIGQGTPPAPGGG